MSPLSTKTSIYLVSLIGLLGCCYFSPFFSSLSTKTVVPYFVESTTPTSTSSTTTTTSDPTNSNVEKQKTEKKKKKKKKKKRFNNKSTISSSSSRDIEASITSDWPTTPFSPLCEAWSYLNDLTSSDGDTIKSSKLKWSYLDYLVNSLNENQVSIMDSCLASSSSTTTTENHDDGECSYVNSRHLAMSAIEYAYQQQQSLSSSSSTDEYADDLKLAEYSLSLRAHSPLCELHRSLARDIFFSSSSSEEKEEIPEAFVVYGGFIIDSTEDLFEIWKQKQEITKEQEDEQQQQQENILLPGEDLDLQKPTSNENDFIVLYGHVGTTAFSNFYKELTENLPTNNSFIVRHMGAIDYEERVSEGIMKKGAIHSASKTVLQGYGIRLDIKNMEYLAFDDKSTDDDYYEDESDEDKVVESESQNLLPSILSKDDFVAGVNLNKLAKRNAIQIERDDEEKEDSNPLLKVYDKLEQLHTHQLKSSEIIPPKWARRNLPLQASAAIYNAISNKSLEAFMDITQNLPSLASSLIETIDIASVNKMKKAALEIESDLNIFNSPTGCKLLGIPPPRGMGGSGDRAAMMEQLRGGGGDKSSSSIPPFGFFVNGRRIPIERPSFNLFELLQIIKKERSLLKDMQSYFYPLTYGKEGLNDALYQIFAGGGYEHLHELEPFLSENNNIMKPESEDDLDDDSPSIRIDVGRGGSKSILYLNNIEKDVEFSRYPSSLQTLLYGGMVGGGQGMMVRRNLFTFLLVIDPISSPKDAYNYLSFIMRLFQSQVPVRLGVLMVDNNDDITERGISSEKESKADQTLLTTELVLETLRMVKDEFGTSLSINFLSNILQVLQNYEQNIDEQQSAMSIDTYLMATLDFFSNYFSRMNMMGGGRGDTPFHSKQELRDFLEEKGYWKKSTSSEMYTNGVKFATSKGLKPGMAFLNGIPLVSSSSPSHQEDNIKIFQDEHSNIINMVATGELNDNTRSIYAKLLSGGNLYQKYHPLLTQTSTANKDDKRNDGGISNNKIYLGGDLYNNHNSNSNISDPSYLSTTPQFLSFATSNDDDELTFFTIDAILDFSEMSGFDIAAKFLGVIQQIQDLQSQKDEDPSFKGTSLSYRIIPTNNLKPEFAFLWDTISTESMSLEQRTSIINGYLDSIKDISSDEEIGKESFVDFLKKYGSEEGSKNRQHIEQFIELMQTEDDDVKSYNADNLFKTPTHLQSNAEEKTNMIVVNGRLYSLSSSSPFGLEDIKILVSLETKYSKVLTKLFRPFFKVEDNVEEIIRLHYMIASTISYFANLSSKTENDSRHGALLHEKVFQKKLENNPLSFLYNNKNGKTGLQNRVVAVLDPLSDAAQRVAPILLAVRDQLNLYLHVVFTPRSNYVATESDHGNTNAGERKKGIPINSYYRFVTSTTTSSTTTSIFRNLPKNHILTLHMDVPEPWNVQQVYAIQDTDNLRCDVDLGCGDDAFLEIQQDKQVSDSYDNGDRTTKVISSNGNTRIEYGMKNLLIFGQCFDVSSSNGNPPNGLQLTLTKVAEKASLYTNISKNYDEAVVGVDGTITSRIDTENNSSIRNNGHPFSDTLVMKTVGFYQLRAIPGVWDLTIAKGTVGASAFSIVKPYNEMYSSTLVPVEKKRIFMKDFVNHAEILMVRKTPKYYNSETMDLHLGETISGVTETTTKEDEEDIIHVFSLATGHFYERLLRIMMLSVRKRASTKVVKFWLFENYLSPSFKEAASAMAEQFDGGIQIEYVTYKWPEWLRGQSQKQRIIWGYKILFLDVLFPLDVKKIIYGKLS